MEKKLYRIENGKKLCGVCGGIAEYLEIDATIVRIAWVFVSLMACIGIIAYIVCAFLMPVKPESL